MMLRFRQDVVALKPKIVVILAGSNDVAEDIGNSCAGLALLLTARASRKRG